VLLWHMCVQAVCLQHGVQDEWGSEHGQMEGINIPAVLLSVSPRTLFVFLP
jgi:hypothetical protein